MLPDEENNFENENSFSDYFFLLQSYIINTKGLSRLGGCGLAAGGQFNRNGTKLFTRFGEVSTLSVVVAHSS